MMNKGSWRTKKEPFKKRSSIQIKQNMIYNFTKYGEKNSNKMLSTTNENKNENINNSLYENCTIDYEKKNKAKKCLLYLLNIKSNGRFCPEIVDYFKKMKDTKIKEEEDDEEELKQIHEENLDKSIKNQSNIIDNKNNPINHKRNTKLENQVIEKQQELNLINNNKIDYKQKENVTINIKEENNLINLIDKQNESNFDNKDINMIKIDNENLAKDEIIENHINYDNEFQQKKIINEEHKNENKNSTLYFNEIKNKKNPKKKSLKKRNKIDVIYNLQRSELQKYGNYHSSLKSAIQSNLAKNKGHKKK